MCSYWDIALAQDMNQDGIFSISDIVLWLKYFFFLPGDFFIGLIQPLIPELMRFLEIESSLCHGFLSAILSAVIWLLAWFIVSFLTTAIRGYFEGLTPEEEEEE